MNSLTKNWTNYNAFLQVLESFKIMDYSFLLGIHNIDMALREKQVSPCFSVLKSSVQSGVVAVRIVLNSTKSNT